MTVSQKVSASLLIAVVLFAGFAALAFTGLFELVEARFYNPTIAKGLERELAADAAVTGAYFSELSDRFSSELAEGAIKRSFLPNQSAQDVFERSRRFGLLMEGVSGLQSVRFVDSAGKRIHFSTARGDELRRDRLSVAYRNYGEADGDLPFETVAAPEGSASRIIVDAASDRFVFVFPFLDSFDVYKGTAIFSVSIRGLAERLTAEGRLRVGEDLSLVAEPAGAVAGLPRVGHEALVAAVASVWSDGTFGPTPLASGGSGSSYALISARTPGGFITGRLVNETLFAFPPAMKAILLASFFLTVYLVVFLIFNLRQDSLTVIRDRIKRFQIALMEEYYDRKGDLDWNRWRRELELRREEVRAELKRDLGGTVPKRLAADVDELIDKSWDELLTAIGGRMGAPVTAQIDEGHLQDILGRVMALAPVAAAVPSARKTKAKKAGGPKPLGVEAPVPPEISEAVEPLEEFEDAEEVEEAGAVEDLEEIEEAEEAESVEQAEEPEEAEAVEDLEEIAEADEVEDGEAVEDLEETAEAEQVEDAEAVEDLEEIAEADEVEDAETVEDLEETAEAEEAVEAGGVENLKETPEAEEAAEAEALEDLEETAEAEEVVEIEAFAEPTETPEAEDSEAIGAAEEAVVEAEVQEYETAEAVEEAEEANAETEALAESTESPETEEIEDAEPAEEHAAETQVEEYEIAEVVEEAEEASAVGEAVEGLAETSEAEETSAEAEVEEYETAEAVEELEEIEAAEEPEELESLEEWEEITGVEEFGLAEGIAVQAVEEMEEIEPVEELEEIEAVEELEEIAEAEEVVGLEEFDAELSKTMDLDRIAAAIEFAPMPPNEEEEALPELEIVSPFDGMLSDLDKQIDNAEVESIESEEAAEPPENIVVNLEDVATLEPLEPLLKPYRLFSAAPMDEIEALEPIGGEEEDAAELLAEEDEAIEIHEGIPYVSPSAGETFLDADRFDPDLRELVDSVIDRKI